MSRSSGPDLPPAKLNRESLKEAAALFRYVLPYRVKFVVALVALLFSSLLGLVFPYVTGQLIDGALGGTQEGFFGDIDHIAITLFVALGAQAAFGYFQSLWFVEVGERSLNDLRRESYSKIISLPMAFFAQRRVGELTSRLSADLTQLQETLTSTLAQLLRQATILIGGLVLIFYTSVKLTLVMLLSLPVLIALAVYFGRKIRQLSRQAQDKLADSNTVVEETLQGITNVKAFANEAYEINRYRHAVEVYLTTVLRNARFRGAFFSLIIFGLFSAIILVLWVGARFVQAGELTVGELTSFILYTTFVGAAMGSFAELYSQVQRTVGATERIREILREPSEEIDLSPRTMSYAQQLPRLRGEVEFEHVEFSYPTRKEVKVLKGVSFSAKSGERVAFVGPSGAGKSTIVSLILRFYTPDAGRILIDGRDSREYPLTALRNQMSIVPQDVMLFGGTIAENIAYGNPQASEARLLLLPSKHMLTNLSRRFQKVTRRWLASAALNFQVGSVSVLQLHVLF